MNNEVLDCNRRLEELDKDIASEEALLREDKRAAREARDREVEEVQSRHDDLVAQQQSAINQVIVEKARRDSLEESKRGQQSLKTNACARIQECTDAIRRARDRERDRLNAFGQNINVVIQRIERQTWVGEKPIGPLGRFVTLKDPQWKFPMQSQLGSLMFAFAITNNVDREALKRILRETRK